MGSQRTGSLSFALLMGFIIVSLLMGLSAWFLFCLPQQTIDSTQICCLMCYFYVSSSFPQFLSSALLLVGGTGHLFWLFGTFVHLFCVWGMLHFLSPLLNSGRAQKLTSLANVLCSHAHTYYSGSDISSDSRYWRQLLESSRLYLWKAGCHCLGG